MIILFWHLYSIPAFWNFVSITLGMSIWSANILFALLSFLFVVLLAILLDFIEIVLSDHLLDIMYVFLSFVYVALLIAPTFSPTLAFLLFLIMIASFPFTRGDK